jgi:hypothetical protein
MMNDYLDNSTEAVWNKPTPEQEFDCWEAWTIPFNTPPF